MSWLKKMWSWLVNLGKNPLVQQFWSFLKDLFKAEMSLIMQKLLEIALQAVSNLAATDLSNADKRTQAFNQIKQQALDAGLIITDSMVNLAIEMAVQALKQKLDQVPLPVVTSAKKKGK